MRRLSLGVLDLYCGVGGFSLGLQMAGFSINVGIDNAKFAVQTFEYNFPKAAVLQRDLENYPPSSLEKEQGRSVGDFDVIIGGPPCQGFSITGPRNFDDPRNKLYLEFIEYVRYYMPRAFIIENVPGLVGLYGGRVKDKILQRFREIGYTTVFEVLPASDYGVPQDRRRVFFVGLKGKRYFKFPAPTHIDMDKRSTLINGASFPLKVTVADAISDLPLLENELGAEESEYTNPPLTEYQQFCRQKSKKLHNHVAARHKDTTRRIIALVPEGKDYRVLPKNLQKTRNFHIAWTRLDSKKPAPTVDTGHRHHFHPWANRVPTVRENARFQSFPDRFVFKGPKTSQYVQVGNAVPPLHAKALGQELMKWL